MSSPFERPIERAGYSGRPTDRSLEQVGISGAQRPASAEYGRERLPSDQTSVVIPKRRGRGPGRVELTELVTQLSARDLAVMELVAEHRFLTTRHLESFCFQDHATPVSGARTARRVLARLERLGLIERTTRRVGGLQAGSGSSTWMLTSTGQRLRGIRDGRGAVGKVREPGERFVAHYLAIADARLALVQAERAGQLVVIQSVIEPRAWRNFTGLGGSAEILKPDLAAITALSKDADFEDHWFIEIDRGTESLPTLIKQCHRYETYRSTGQAQEADGVFPIIVWVVPDEQRATKVRERIAGSRGLDSAHYRVTTPDGFVELIKAGAA
jgi:hypothetical protein